MRYIDIEDGQPVGQPFSKPSTMAVPNTRGGTATVGSATWTATDFLPFGKVPVEGAADPAIEVETGYTYDAEAGVASPVIEPRPIAEVQAEACAKIDAAAETARLAFITPGAGQALVYQRKEAQARACLAAYDAQNQPPAGTYPALEAEVGITGADTVGVATVVAGMADAWAAIGDSIEAIRLGAKKAVGEAAAPADIPPIVAAVEWPSPA